MEMNGPRNLASVVSRRRSSWSTRSVHVLYWVGIKKEPGKVEKSDSRSTELEEHLQIQWLQNSAGTVTGDPPAGRPLPAYPSHTSMAEIH